MHTNAYFSIVFTDSVDDAGSMQAFQQHGVVVFINIINQRLVTTRAYTKRCVDGKAFRRSFSFVHLKCLAQFV